MFCVKLFELNIPKNNADKMFLKDLRMLFYPITIHVCSLAIVLSEFSIKRSMYVVTEVNYLTRKDQRSDIFIIRIWNFST
jgi:hypothetical protein